MKHKLAAFFLLLQSLSVFAADMLVTVQTSGEPECPTKGKFYGYYTSSQGPGDESFSKIRDLAEKEHHPFFVVYAKDGCPTCTALLNSLKEWARAYPTCLGYGDSLNGYFRGNSSGTGPKACRDAYEFIKGLGGSGTCHMMALYGVCEDGTIYKKTSAAQTDYVTFGKWKVAQCDAFWALFEKHRYVPPKSSVKFADGELEAVQATEKVYVDLVRTNNFDLVKTNWVVATYPEGRVATNAVAWSEGQKNCEFAVSMLTNGTSVFVEGGKVMLELLNTNKISIATNYISFVAMPETDFANPVVSAGENGAKFGEWTLDFAAATGKVYSANIYLQPDTNQTASSKVAVSVNVVLSASNRCNEVTVATGQEFADRVKEITGKDFDYGSYPAVTNVFACSFGFELTNTVTSVFTNRIASSERKEERRTAVSQRTYMMQSEGSAVTTNTIPDAVSSNFIFEATNETVYTLTNSEHPVLGECIVLTNETKIQVADFVCVTVYTNITDGTFSRTYVTNDISFFITNLTTTVYTNEWTSAPVKRSSFEVERNSPVWTNATYVIWPCAVETYSTNSLPENGTAVELSRPFTFEATNTVRYVLADADHVNGSSETVDAETFRVTGTVPDGGTNVYHRIAPDYISVGVTSVDHVLANEGYCIVYPGMQTNKWETWQGSEDDKFTTKHSCEIPMTNYWNVTLADASSEESKFLDELTKTECELAFNRYYYSVRTNSYQHGAEKFTGKSDGGRAEYEGLKAFTLAVTVKDGEAASEAFARDVIASTNFSDWCETAQIVPVLLSPEALDEAWKSRNGFSADDIAELADASAAITNAYSLEAGEIVLIRPDGEMAGRLAMQVKDGACDVDENIARLGELIAMANADAAECENDGFDGAMALEYKVESATNTLHVSDKSDVFKLVDVPTNTAVAFTNEAGIAFAVLDENGNEIAPRVKDVWVFDTTNVYLAVSAYTDETAVTNLYGGKSEIAYTVKVAPAPENPGTVGFVISEDYVEEPENNPDSVTDSEIIYELRVARTGGLTGEVKVKISLDEVNTTAYAMITNSITYRYVWTNDVELVWRDLEVGEKTVPVVLINDEICFGAKGERDLIVFTNEVVSGSATPGESSFALTYKETDPEGYGELSFVRTDPLASTNGIVYVRGGGTVTFSVDRADGVNTSVSGTLKTTFGTFDSDTLVWPDFVGTEQSTVLRVPSLASGSRNFTVTLSGSSGVSVVGGNRITCCVLADDAPAFAGAGDWTTVQYVSFSNTVQLTGVPEGWTVVSAAKMQGSLPAGVTAKVDKDSGAIVFSGVPTVGGKDFFSLWRIVFRDGEGRINYSFPVEVRIKVLLLGGTKENDYNDALNPKFAAARSWTSLPVTNITGRLVGLLNMTVAKNGRTSARYTKAGGVNVSFSAAGLASVDASGNAVVEASRKVRGVNYSLAATLCPEGAMSVEVTDPEAEGETVATMALPDGAEPWSRTCTAEKWSGNYTFVLAHDEGGEWDQDTLCYGSAALQVKFKTTSQYQSGRTQYAGVLPNGKTVSGSATFVPVAKDAVEATLPVFFTSSSDTFGTLLNVSTNEGACVYGTEGTTSYWSHVEANYDSLSYENEYFAYGSRFLAGSGNQTYGFTVDGNQSGAAVKSSGSRMSVADKGGSFSLAFSFNSSFGLATGSFKIPRSETDTRLASVSWRGVATPGWDPFMAGAYWRNVTTNVVNSKTGQTVKRTVREGGAVGLTDK